MGEVFDFVVSPSGGVAGKALLGADDVVVVLAGLHHVGAFFRDRLRALRARPDDGVLEQMRWMRPACTRCWRACMPRAA